MDEIKADSEIKQYILSQTTVDVPELQKRFSLSYKETKAVVDELVNASVLKYASGISYNVCAEAGSELQSVYKPKDEKEAFCIKALWACLKSGIVSTVTVQRKFAVGYARASAAIEWLEENGYITMYPERTVKIKLDDYIAKFGIPEGEIITEEERQRRYIEERRMALTERLHAMDDDDYDDDDDEDDDEDGGEEDSDDEDGGEEDSDDEDGGEEDSVSDKPEKRRFDLKSAVVECVGMAVQDGDEENTYVIGFGDCKFEMKLIHDGSDLKLSDAGKTLAQTGQTKRKVNNLLKSFPYVSLDGEELSIIVENPLRTFMGILQLYAAVTAVKMLK